MQIREVRKPDIRKVEDSSVLREEGWSTYMDIENRLVVFVGSALSNFYVDRTNVDPDGMPLVYFDRQVVTRVRRMTDDEFETCMREYTDNMLMSVGRREVGPDKRSKKKEVKEEDDE